MIFLLTAMKVYYILDPNLESILEPKDGEVASLKKRKMKRAEDDLFYRGHIMNAFLDCLYNFYKEVKTAKEIYDALEFKFKVQKEGTNKFLNTKYFNFCMTDKKPILD